jgi:hypothetical protein
MKVATHFFKKTLDLIKKGKEGYDISEEEKKKYLFSKKRPAIFKKKVQIGGGVRKN